jgi:hypothetical protein
MRPAPNRDRPRRSVLLRRAVLAGLLVAALVAGMVVLVRTSGHPSWFDAGSTGTPAPPVPTRGEQAPPSPAAPTLSLMPTADWHTASPPGTRIEGYADRTSVLPGASVGLRVAATAASFTVSAFRMGSYGFEQAALAWQGGPYPLVAQPDPAFAPDTRTVTAPWQQATTVTATDWPPGAYLLRLQGADGAQSYVPLTVRSPTTAGRIVLVQAVTTWQAYNSWGGWSLYHGPDGQGESRAYAVSFDRPYGEQAGAGDFLGNELPLVTFAEKLGIPLGYATDVDLHDDPGLLAGAFAVVSPGHDEYYSTAMRDALTAARDAGTNIFFLGANAVYRHIRLSPTDVGADRLETDYKDAGLDPVTRTDPAESTAQWRRPPLNRPESDLVGGFYQCNPGQANLVVAPTLSWLTDGMGLQPGQELGAIVGPEYDRVDLRVPTPHPLQVLFHSPIRCTGQGGIDDASDVTYYTTPSGAAVFDSGTSKWECALDDQACGTGWGDPATFQVVREVTRRLLMAASLGSIGTTHPAVDTTGGPLGRDDGIGGIAPAGG